MESARKCQVLFRRRVHVDGDKVISGAGHVFKVSTTTRSVGPRDIPQTVLSSTDPHGWPLQWIVTTFDLYLLCLLLSTPNPSGSNEAKLSSSQSNEASSS